MDDKFDPEAFFQRVLEEMRFAQDACHEGNYERMKEILDDLLKLLPFFSLESWCDDHLALDDALRDWLDKRCELMLNAGSVFGPEDTVTLSVRLPLDSAKARARGIAQHDAHVRNGFQTTHRFTADSGVGFDAWFGSGEVSLEGGLILGAERALPGGGRIIPVLDAEFVPGAKVPRTRWRILASDLQRPQRRVCGWIVLDELGSGRLGLQVCLDDAETGVHGPIWFDAPITHRRGMLQIGVTMPQSALDLFPVGDSIHHLFDLVTFGDEAIDASDEEEFDPCAREGGASHRALAWLQRLRTVFPECFQTSGTSPQGG